MKKQYLICYNYGMGGAWGLMLARSELEISQKYPCIEIVHHRPEWMTDPEYERIAAVNSFDIDDEPLGWLAKLKH